MLLLTLLLACTRVPTKDTGSDDTAASTGPDEDADGFSAAEGDCDDADPATYPGAVELCDGRDQDCDSDVDEGVRRTWYADADQDGFGDPDDGVEACEALAGRIDTATDCDDTRASVYPGAAEACDAVDNDCDGATDEDGTRTWYADSDGDGWGDPGTAVVDCREVRAGYVLLDGDCDDTTAQVYPDRPEDCDEVDNDCDSEVDEGVTTTFWADLDGDAWGDDVLPQQACALPTGYARAAGDCDDADAAYHPSARESCDDPRDLNCDGSVAYGDTDGDGTAACNDCDDSRADVRPGAAETCNGLDDDCDGATDDADGSLDRSTTRAWHPDVDLDGYGDSALSLSSCDAPSGWRADATDCDDRDAAVHPTAPETCDAVDEDCDGLVDDDDPDRLLSTASAWYLDADSDGYGDAGASTAACDAPAGHVPDDTDCEDADAGVNPAAPEVCGGGDEDCDGLIDDDDPGLRASSTSRWYDDTDGDGFGDPGSVTRTCDAPAGALSDARDCDDGDATVNPDAAETCDGVDEDCDGLVDDDDPDRTGGSTWYADADGDGYGTSSASTLACDAPAAHVAVAGDCDDAASGINPSATEVCGGGDEDCDGLVDDADPGRTGGSRFYTDRDGDGYGVSSGSTLACAASAGTSATAGDCDDGARTTYPGATEVCSNATDEDCDGSYSEGCPTSYYTCSVYDALDSGGTYSCSGSGSVYVESVYLQVGCNDGETGYYTATFSDGSSVSFSAGCGTTTAFTPRWTTGVTLYMHSGGGPDNHISHQAWGYTYR